VTGVQNEILDSEVISSGQGLKPDKSQRPVKFKPLPAT